MGLIIEFDAYLLRGQNVQNVINSRLCIDLQNNIVACQKLNCGKIEIMANEYGGIQWNIATSKLNHF